MVLPVVKLAFLAVKQVAKPVANRIKSSALQSDTIRAAMVAVGRRLHYNNIQIARIADGQAALKKERVQVLNEKEVCAAGPKHSFSRSATEPPIFMVPSTGSLERRRLLG